uniref:Uncharacterized protein n=1 Tax=Arundo donax TaxID=35708 RepID=A0A0A9DH27_ARUDO
MPVHQQGSQHTEAQKLTVAAARSVKWPAARRTLYSSPRAAYSRTRTTRSSSWNQAKRQSTLGWSSPCCISISRRRCAWNRYFSSFALYSTLSATTYPLCFSRAT